MFSFSLSLPLVFSVARARASFSRHSYGVDHGLSTEQFPVSAYVGSSKNLEDLAHKTGDLAHKTGTPPHKTGNLAHKTGHFAHKTGDLAHKTGDLAHKTGDLAHKTGDLAHKTGDLAHKTGDLAHKTGDLAHKTGGLAHKTGDLPHKTGDLARKTEGTYALAQTTRCWRAGGRAGMKKGWGVKSDTTEGPSWGYPKVVLGAIRSFLEPFCGHSSPKVDEIFQK
jgi:hypothetical protein